MVYALPAIVFAMLGYMFWLSAFQLRRDRLRSQRAQRSAVILTPRQRIRANLGRAFVPPADRPDWQARLLSDLAVPAARRRDAA
jgi:hypothetical protein